MEDDPKSMIKLKYVKVQSFKLSLRQAQRSQGALLVSMAELVSVVGPVETTEITHHTFWIVTTFYANFLN